MSEIKKSMIIWGIVSAILTMILFNKNYESYNQITILLLGANFFIKSIAFVVCVILGTITGYISNLIREFVFSTGIIQQPDNFLLAMFLNIGLRAFGVFIGISIGMLIILKPFVNKTKGEFLAGCLTYSSSLNSYCECTYDKLEEKYTSDGLKKIGLRKISSQLANIKNKSSDIQNEFLDIAFECAKEKLNATDQEIALIKNMVQKPGTPANSLPETSQLDQTQIPVQTDKEPAPVVKPVENANLISTNESPTLSEQATTSLKSPEKVASPIDTNTLQTDKFNGVVMGRCDMGSCWWWKIEKTENIQSQNQETLLKAYVTTTSVDYPDAEVEKNGYPDSPPKQSQWENIKEVFVLCSNKFPTYIEYDEEQKKFIGTIPFDQNNTTSGATEGIGNFYLHMCNGGKEAQFEISSEAEFSAVTFEKPTDIFNHPKPKVETEQTASSPTAESSENTSQSETSQQISDSQIQTEGTPKTAEDHIQKMLQGAVTDDGIGIQASKRYLESLPKPAKGDKKAADEINKEALKFIKKQQYDQAVPLFEKASQIDPSDVETLNNYGFALMMSNNLEQAETVLIKTLVMKPDRASAWSNLGYTFAHQGKEQLAVASYLNTYLFSKNPKKTLQIFEKQLAQESNANVKNALTKAVDEINTDYD